MTQFLDLELVLYKLIDRIPSTTTFFTAYRLLECHCGCINNTSCISEGCLQVIVTTEHALCFSCVARKEDNFLKFNH